MENSPLKVGDSYEYLFSFSQEQVNAFSELTGDFNPLHHDKEFAAQTPFKEPIIHGFLAGSVFSKVLGMEFPGKGSIYVSQSMSFLRPMYVKKYYKAVFTVLNIDPTKKKGTIRTQIFDVEKNKQTIEGEAVIINERFVQ
ncbi:MAG: MaoC family dehydratase [Cytophagales bacterium]|nr:MaoC family dehydratase [Cytophagales bacterium]MDW8383616.1 MaoC family dehydratase [Flammeovirgaceae bacterium]